MAPISPKAKLQRTETAASRAAQPSAGGEPAEGSPARVRGSLRMELLFNLSFLAAAALILSLWTTSILQLPRFAGPNAAVWLVVLVALDLTVFIALGSFLIDRLVIRPLTETAVAAEAIAAGDYQRRIAPGDTREIAMLTAALNGLTDQLLSNQARLAENVQSLDETNRRLVAAQQDLVQAEKLASIGRLAAGVAHEIGNPLGALLGYVAVLRRRGGSDAELLGGMEREAKRIDRIVRGLLDYARPGSAAREDVDVNAAIRRVLDLLREQGRLGGVTIELDLAPTLPPVDAAAHQIDQILLNLVTNAEAAMSGTGCLTITTRREQFQPGYPARQRRADDPPGIDYSHLRRMRQGFSGHPDRLESGAGVVRVTVADTGPGIPEEHLSHIFDPFFTTKPPGEGTGLGLAIVTSTMAELGGRITAASEEGGAVFTLLFPAAEGDS